MDGFYFPMTREELDQLREHFRQIWIRMNGLNQVANPIRDEVLGGLEILQNVEIR